MCAPLNGAMEKRKTPSGSTATQGNDTVMKINPYLFFNKQCGDAFLFYEKALGGKNLVVMTYGDAPGMAEHTPPGMKDAVIHASVMIGDTILMGSDGSGQEEVGKPQGFSVSLQPKTPEEARRAFDALAAGGTVRMPLDKTFFSPAFGMLTDKFGVPWMVNCEQNG
jgi:PhnB protein